MITKGVEDEVFVLNDYGIQISIFSLIDFVNEYPDEFEVQSHKTEDLLLLRRSDGLNKGHLNKMSQERVNEPLLGTILNDENWIIDGNHRLIRRVIDNYPETSVIIIPEILIGNFIAPL